MKNEFPYPVELSDLIATDIVDRLELKGKAPEQAQGLISYLTEQFGNPVIESKDRGEEILKFVLPNNSVTLIRLVDKGLLTGFIILAQVMPPLPPPPCPAGITTLMAWGSGTATSTGLGVLIRGPGAVILEASAKGLIDLGRSILAIRTTLCAACPATCTCLTYPSGIDLPTISVSLIRRFGIPIGYSVTVWHWQQMSSICI